jgi:NADH:ubiquinone oxidoreductase subunit 3 (subunit A)
VDADKGITITCTEVADGASLQCNVSLPRLGDVCRYAPEEKAMNNPYESPPSSVATVPVSSHSYGGIRRKICFFAILPLGFLWAISQRGAGLVGFVAFFVIILVLLYYRVKNIGLSSWTWCLAFIPLINILFLAYCLIVPEGYADTRKLDGRAYLLMTPLLFIIGLFAIALVLDLVRMVQMAT